MDYGRLQMESGKYSGECINISALNKTHVVNGSAELILSDINLSVTEQGFISVVGPSGCGKSTLLNIIAGLDDPDSGSIKIKGIDGPRLGKIGYMQQKDLLLPWRTVLDNASLGLETQGLSKKEARDRVLSELEAFGLSGYEHMYPYALSGGMRQRVAFLRTMVMDQAIVLLDEPFGALDALTRVQMQRWLLDIWELMDKTIVLVTHDVDEALFLSDTICLLSARPGSNASTIAVDIPRPRQHDVLSSPDFVSMKHALLSRLWSYID
tara:strand:+ start:1573 stop:2373 length:801 start_codon:yes stop_codon:yes gene_type:complete